jgi:hypothetical protein
MEEKIMTTHERLNELKANFSAEQETTKEVYLETEAELVKLLGEYIDKAPVSCKLYGNGKVVAVTGNTLEDMIVDIAIVDDTTRRFSLLHIMNNTFVKFEDDSEINEIWNSAFEVHTNLTNAYRACEAKARQLAIEEAKKIETEKKAEEKYQKQKEKAVRDFDELLNQARSLSAVDEFYFAIGWLTKHISKVSVAIPDYLQSAFEQHFGTDAEPYVVDSKKRTSGGFAFQWGIGMTARLKSKDLGPIPTILTPYLNPAGKALSNTSFIWDLIETYGFKFGKKQDSDLIRSKVPAKYIPSFEAGLTA